MSGPLSEGCCFSRCWNCVFFREKPIENDSMELPKFRENDVRVTSIFSDLVSSSAPSTQRAVTTKTLRNWPNFESREMEKSVVLDEPSRLRE